MTTPTPAPGKGTPAPTATTRGAHLPNADGFTKKQQPKPPALPAKPAPKKRKSAPKKRGGK